MLTVKKYSNEENYIWKQLFALQTKQVLSSWKVSKIILEWFKSVPFSSIKIPNANKFSTQLKQINWWELVDAENPYLEKDLWFKHLLNKKFPVTSYIRSIDELEFTTHPDLFHEYFGHMPQMFWSIFPSIEYKTAKIYESITDEHIKQYLFNLSMYTVEYWVILENWEPKVVGAGLLSSIGDMKRFISNEFTLEKANLDQIISTSPSPYRPKKKLFVFDSISQFSTMLDMFVEKYLIV